MATTTERLSPDITRSSQSEEPYVPSRHLHLVQIDEDATLLVTYGRSSRGEDLEAGLHEVGEHVAGPGKLYRIRTHKDTKVSQIANVVASSAVLGASVAMLALSALLGIMEGTLPWVFWLIPAIGALGVCLGSALDILFPPEEQ